MGDTPDMIYCPSCGGNSRLIGALGAGCAYHCRDCGWVIGMPPEEARLYMQTDILEDET